MTLQKGGGLVQETNGGYFLKVVKKSNSNKIKHLFGLHFFSCSIFLSKMGGFKWTLIRKLNRVQCN